MKTYKLWIDGQWCDPASGKWLDTTNPYSGEVWTRIPLGNAEDIDVAVQAAFQAYHEGSWSQLNATERGRLLNKLADSLAEQAENLAELEVRDNGKIFSEAVSQCQYMTEWFRYYGGLSDKIEGAVPPIDNREVLNFTRYEPLGVCACITAWNSPLLQLAWKAAPALAADNTIVVKPSEYTSVSTLEFARIAHESGIPSGVINVVTGLGNDVGEALTRHKLVKKVAFTGSELGGTAVNSAAASDFKRVTLELGGKSPNIVFADANQDLALPGVVSGIFAASGQICTAGSRLLLEDTIYDEFLARLIDMAGQAKLGDPMSPKTDIGPITTEAQYKKICSYIEIAKSEGAKCLFGGNLSPLKDARGYFVEPTVFVDVTPDMRIPQEEIFGPVLAVMRFKTEDEAIEIANGVNYGLAAGVWTENLRKAIKMSERLEAGTIWVNTYRSASFTTPFGGYKASGLGRENGIEAIKQYLQVKSVWFSTSPKAKNPFWICFPSQLKMGSVKVVAGPRKPLKTFMFSKAFSFPRSAIWKVGKLLANILIRTSAVMRRSDELPVPLGVNPRFLILPWLEIANLGSHILAIVCRRLPEDWTARYNTAPVMIETFVETPRYTGAVYRASGWTRVGTTRGRGRYDRDKLYDKPRKDIWLRPLRRDWKRTLNR